MAKNYQAVRCTGKSMLPLLAPGGVAFINPSKTLFVKGDIVLLRHGRSGYIHRVISVDLRRMRIQTQGDNAKMPDPWTPIAQVGGIATRYLCHNASINLESASANALGWMLPAIAHFFFRWENTRRLIRLMIRNPKTHRIIHSLVR